MSGPLLADRWPEGDSRRVLIFRALCDVLKADAVLSSAGVTWRTWDGDPRDAMDPAKQELPWIRLTPIQSAMHLGTESDWEVAFRVKFEIAVEGTAWDDLGNLSDAFTKALRYSRPTFGGQTVLNALRAAGATVHDFEQGGFSPFRAEGPASEPGQAAGPVVEDLIGTGVIRIEFFDYAVD